MRMTNEDFFEKHGDMFKDCFDFSIGNGWLKIVDNLCVGIKTYCADTNSELPSVQQVKEKFGGLRFYADGCDSYIDKLISDAEASCDKTCEVCGSPGTLRKSGWWKTLCDVHNKKD